MSFISEAESSIRMLFDTTNAGFHVDPSKGLSHLESWTQHLRSIDQPATRLMVTELETLRGHVNNNNAAGMALSFQSLGEMTAQAALTTHNFSGEGDKARELSQKLISAAGNLRHIAASQVVQH
ncbi:hypothetical protein ACVWYF_001728 [Hymenobacter sp. UYAg731]